MLLQVRIAKQNQEAGDCRTKNVRQLTTAASDGAVAAIGACEYIDSELDTKNTK